MLHLKNRTKRSSSFCLHHYTAASSTYFTEYIGKQK